MRSILIQFLFIFSLAGFQKGYAQDVFDLPIFESLTPQKRLLDWLIMKDDAKVTSVDQWNHQRHPEIKHLFCYCIYGYAPPAPDNMHLMVKLYVYLLIGQSNMAGRAPFSEDDSGIIPGCYLLNAEDKWEPAKNPLNRYSTIRKKLEMQKMNPGYTFAQTMLTEEPGVSLGLVVNAQGGTSIEQWARGTHFYNEAVRRAKTAAADGILKGILWHQGESNAGSPGSYLMKLKSLVQDLRNDLGMPDLPFVAGQVFYDAETKPTTQQINEQIAKLPETVPHTGYVSSEGLTTIDNTHFDSKSMKLLGERYARQMLKLTKKLEQ